MEAATSTLHQSFGLGPRGPNAPHGAQQTQGPPQPTPGPSATPHPEEQHHKPFFFVQPSQPYVPMQTMQWPMPLAMPMSYNPYYGYPGIGYGMPMIHHYQPNPYMESPGFVVPHSHLHLMDYRRMLNPHYYHSMAYHARRLRYQHNVPSREMTSCEVQTEPVSLTPRTSTPGSGSAEASVCFETVSIPTNQSLSPSLSVQEDQTLEVKDMMPSTTTRTPPNGSFVIQTEEVRIECCTTPVGLQVLHSRETAEVSHSFSQDVVQCRSLHQSHMLQDDNLCPSVDQSEQALQPCPDILLVGTPSGSETLPALEESRTQTDPVTHTADLSSRASHTDVEERSKKPLSAKNYDFKVIHLPFDSKYLNELRKMESTVWSCLEDTSVPSPELLIESHEETEAEVPSADALIIREEVAPEEVVPMIEMPLLPEEHLQNLVPTVELPEEMVFEVDTCPTILVPVVEEAFVEPNLTLDNSPLKVDEKEQTCKTNQDTSFESLPAYLPSSSWLSDFDHAHYCSKVPPTPKKHSKPSNNSDLDVPTRRRKLDLEYKDPAVRKPKERYKPKGKVDRRSLSDHECCMSRNFNENTFIPYGLEGQRLCSRCLTKQRVYTSASPKLDGQALKRKVAPFQQWNDFPTCEHCKSHPKKHLTKKGYSPKVCCPRGHDTEEESSENSSCCAGLKWRAAEEPRKFPDNKKPLTSKQNVEKRLCNELHHHPAAWQRLHHCPHGNAIREMDENCAMPISIQDKWRSMDHICLAQRRQPEKSWKGVKANDDASFKNEVRAQQLNKHKKSQSQGTHRKDTRC